MMVETNVTRIPAPAVAWWVEALNYLFLLILAISGASLLWLGCELLWLGGSPWYAAAGLVYVASALLGFIRRPLSIDLFWAFLAVTAIWAIWEVGLNGWALVPRLVMPLMMGLWMLTPFYRRRLGVVRALPGERVIWSALLFVLLAGIGAVIWTNHLPGARTSAYGPSPVNAADGEWTHYGNDQGGDRWSPLTQVTPTNVGLLEPVWTFHSGPLPGGAVGTFEVNPLATGGHIYICTGADDVIALDAETGDLMWRRPTTAKAADAFWFTCRGLAYYRVPAAQGLCAERIYAATVDTKLIALDAATGRPCPNFGKNGTVDMLAGMGPIKKGYYFITSPPTLVQGKLVVGGLVTDGRKVGEPSGVIRAFDAVTGAFVWAFDTGRPDAHDMPKPGEHYSFGTPNSWAPMSADEKLGIVYAPTGNATPDYYGGHRTANDDRFSSSVLALDADTGGVRWSFQTTHHDLWDYDVASQPVLVDLPGRSPGLIAATKRGEIFFLDRRTGVPIGRVEERRVPRGAVAGERLSPAQPFSVGLPSLAGPPPSERSMWGLTPIDQAICRIRFREARFEGTMTPLGTDRPTVIWPGSQGAINWGGVSVDPQHGILIANTSQIANFGYLISRAEADRMGIRPSNAAHMGSIAQMGVPYAAFVTPFLSPLSVPCQQPPYGMISAIDLTSGKELWSHPFGSARDSGPLGLRSYLPIPMGVPNLGGAVTTAGGLIFIGATQDHYFRAYDAASGRELWRSRLPAGAQATPTVYWSKASGRQFVIIAAGGHPGIQSGNSDALIAYALPRSAS